MPYCYGGSDSCTAFYYGWRRAGEHWFARFVWLESVIAGFTFLRQESNDRLIGAWWSDQMVPVAPQQPPTSEGEPVRWERLDAPVPRWAQRFFAETYTPELAEHLKRRSESSD